MKSWRKEASALSQTLLLCRHLPFLPRVSQSLQCLWFCVEDDARMTSVLLMCTVGMQCYVHSILCTVLIQCYVYSRNAVLYVQYKCNVICKVWMQFYVYSFNAVLCVQLEWVLCVQCNVYSVLCPVLKQCSVCFSGQFEHQLVFTIQFKLRLLKLVVLCDHCVGHSKVHCT